MLKQEPPVDDRQVSLQAQMALLDEAQQIKERSRRLMLLMAAFPLAIIILAMLWMSGHSNTNYQNAFQTGYAAGLSESREIIATRRRKDPEFAKTLTDAEVGELATKVYDETAPKLIKKFGKGYAEGWRAGIEQGVRSLK